jgi:hypothetical protein
MTELTGGGHLQNEKEKEGKKRKKKKVQGSERTQTTLKGNERDELTRQNVSVFLDFCLLIHHDPSPVLVSPAPAGR